MSNREDIKKAKASIKKLEKSGKWSGKFSDCLIDAGNWKSFLDCLKKETSKRNNR
jgi:hypothetical protein